MDLVHRPYLARNSSAFDRIRKIRIAEPNRQNPAVKPDVCADLDPAYGLELQFTMADGSIKTMPFPAVAALSRVSSDGYAFMCSMALPDADAERWDKLAKHEWVIQRINRTGKSR